MVQITGVSTTPFGEPNVGERIRFTCLHSEAGVNQGIQGTFTTGATGEYDFQLLTGRYRVEVQQANVFEWMDNGVVEVTAAVTGPLTLVQLVNDYQYVEPEPLPE